MQKIYCSKDIGVDKLKRIADRPVNMRFCRQVNHGINVVFYKYLFYLFLVGNIGTDKAVIGLFFNVGKVFQISCISEFVQVYNGITRVPVYKSSDYMRSYKSRTTCNEN